MPDNLVVFGEIGLSGEVRAVSQTDQRLREAAKLGFGIALMPPRRGRRSGIAAGTNGGLETREIAHLQDLVQQLAGDAPPRRAAGPRPGSRAQAPTPTAVDLLQPTTHSKPADRAPAPQPHRPAGPRRHCTYGPLRILSRPTPPGLFVS